MTCNRCKTAPVWKFTNKTQLCKKCFVDYVERKVFSTIRKFALLPKNSQFLIKKSEDLNTKVLFKIIKDKFPIKFSSKPNIFVPNLSDISEEIFRNILQGYFNKKIANLNQPLSYISDAEIELYAKLKSIKGKRRVRNKTIQELFNKFMKKNPDLEHNVLNAYLQIP